MCEQGNTISMRVPVPAHLSHTGKFHWAEKPVDSCIAELVGDLNSRGILTANSCCGHGSEGSIILHDGREVTLSKAREMIRSSLIVGYDKGDRASEPATVIMREDPDGSLVFVRCEIGAKALSLYRACKFVKRCGEKQ